MPAEKIRRHFIVQISEEEAEMERLLDPGIEALMIDQPSLLRAGPERDAGGTECATGNMGNIMDRQHGDSFPLFVPLLLCRARVGERRSGGVFPSCGR
jgi:hypothetical protein